MLKTESRGENATGFYGLEVGADGKIFFHKEPVKSSVFKNRLIWNSSFASAATDLLLGHCRQSSYGVGKEHCNRNNHPHVNADKSKALIHNGRIPEYPQLKNRYDLLSECDSEILLAMYETGMQFKTDESKLAEEFKDLPDLAVGDRHRMYGMREIFSRINYGAMAVAIAEREENGERYLWLLRNDERPIHVVDMRSEIGQIFFCSTPEIWRQAIDICSEIKAYIPDNQEIIEVPADGLWMIHYNPNVTDVLKQWEIAKYQIQKTKWTDYDEDTDKPLRPSRKVIPAVSLVISGLTADEEVVYLEEEKKKQLSTMPKSKQCENTTTCTAEIDAERSMHSGMEKTVWDIHDQCQRSLAEITTKLFLQVSNANVSDYSAIVDALKDLKLNIEATLLFVS